MTQIHPISRLVSIRHRCASVACLFAIALSVVNVGAADSQKIGFVHTVNVLDRAPQAAVALLGLEKEFQPRDKELLELRDQVRVRETALEKNSLVMAASEIQIRQREINGLQRRLKRLKEEAREDYNFRRNEELAKLQRLVREVIIDIAQEGDYDIVLEQAVYVDRSIDLTDKVLERLKQR